MTPRSKSERVTRALLTIVAAALVAPLVFLVPPHIEWVVGTVITAAYWVRKHWVAEYVVESFEGVCPRCVHALRIKRGTTLRFPHSIVCYNCHEHPALELGEAPPFDPDRKPPAPPKDPKVGERTPLKIWSPAGSDW